jgi:Peptidase_C39 like family
MSHDSSSDSPRGDIQQPESGDNWRWTEVPVQLEQLPDGRESLVAGDPEHCKDFNHKQGANDLGFTQDCGLVSCSDILLQFGVEVTENDVVHHAVDNWECDVKNEPNMDGGTTVDNQAKILSDYGVPAHAQQAESIEDLAVFLEQGHGVIAEVNAGVLWNDPNKYGAGYANHAIVITGVARDPQTDAIQGFYINDSGTGDSARFVDVKTMKGAWNVPDGSTPGTCVVTDVVRT